MLDWLKKRLSPVKRDTPRWQQFAEAVQSFWGEEFDPEIDRARRMRSIYTADEDDARRIVRDLGWYYENDLDESSRILSVAQRKVELLQKDTAIPILNSIRRACPGIEIEWKPLYARMGQIYGTEFFLDHELHETWSVDGAVKLLDGSWAISADAPVGLPEGVWMTSRAALHANLASLEDPSWLDRAKVRANQIRPLHIVFDGFLFYAMIIVRVPISVTPWLHLVKQIPVPYPWCNHSLDGSWKMGMDGQRHRLDGRYLSSAWTVGGGTPGWAHAALFGCRATPWLCVGKEAVVHRVAMPLSLGGEPWLMLDGNWYIGNTPRPFPLFAGAMRKSDTLQVEPQTALCLGTRADIRYPAQPYHLTSTMRIMSDPPHTTVVRLTGGWRLGGVTRPFSLSRRWTLRRGRILVKGRLAGNCASSIGHNLPLGGQPLDASWRLGQGCGGYGFPPRVLRLSGRLLNASWRLGEARGHVVCKNAPVFLGAFKKTVEPHVAISQVSSLLGDKASELSYPKNPINLARQMRLTTWRRLDGSWLVAQHHSGRPNSVPLNGSWNITTVGIDTQAQSKLWSKVIAGNMIQLMGQPLTPAWRIGQGRGGDALTRLVVGMEIQTEAAPSAEPVLCAAKSLSVSYPANPITLQRARRLQPWVNLDGSWLVGEHRGAGISVPLNGSWKIAAVGIRSNTLTSLQSYGICGAYIRLGRAHYRLGNAWYRKIDGSWNVGAFARIDGTWHIDGTVVLRAPRIGPHYRRLDRTWNLGWTKHLDSHWKIGDRGADIEVRIRKAA